MTHRATVPAFGEGLEICQIQTAALQVWLMASLALSLQDRPYVCEKTCGRIGRTRQEAKGRTQAMTQATANPSICDRDSIIYCGNPPFGLPLLNPNSNKGVVHEKHSLRFLCDLFQRHAYRCSDCTSRDASKAASYMDNRIEWWMSWKSAARDHETFCISCHTSGPLRCRTLGSSRRTCRKGPTTDETRRFLKT